MAKKMKYIPLAEGETAALIHAGLRLELAFGTGGVALKWDLTRPMPESVRVLLLMRGVLNENMDGAGI